MSVRRQLHTSAGNWPILAIFRTDLVFFEGVSTRYLIKRQRKLSGSSHPIDRLTAVTLGAALSDRLDGLSDRQIGQLLFDCCWPELYVDSPELIIVTEAIDRLRSTRGGLANEDVQESLERLVCPKCGNEMFLHYGIDEPDFWLCDRVACRHKRYVGGPVRIR